MERFLSTWVASSVALAFSAWLLGGWVTGGYSPVDDAISRLAADGAGRDLLQGPLVP